MFVHDLNQFVTVQLLEETPAVLSLDKLCKDHGLTRNGKSIICKTDNFVPLVVRGSSVNSESSSSSTTPSQESLGTEASLASGKRAAASSSSDSVSERSDDLATRKLGQESWESDKKDKNDPLAVMPFRAPAHISQDSDSEHFTKVAAKSKKHIIFTHFPKDRNCDVCLRTELTKASCRRRTGETLPRAEKFGDMMTADHKVRNEGLETITSTLLWYINLPKNGFNLIRGKQNPHIRREKSLLKFLEPSHAPKVVFSDTTRWSLGKHVRFCHGITARQHLIGPRRMASLKEPSDE